MSVVPLAAIACKAETRPRPEPCSKERPEIPGGLRSNRFGTIGIRPFVFARNAEGPSAPLNEPSMVRLDLQVPYGEVMTTKVPLLPIAAAVLFPGHILSVRLSSPAAIAAVRSAGVAGKVIAATRTQSADGVLAVYGIGVAATIVKLTQLQGSTLVLVRGDFICTVSEMTFDDGFFSVCESAPPATETPDHSSEGLKELLVASSRLVEVLNPSLRKALDEMHDLRQTCFFIATNAPASIEAQIEVLQSVSHRERFAATHRLLAAATPKLEQLKAELIARKEAEALARQSALLNEDEDDSLPVLGRQTSSAAFSLPVAIPDILPPDARRSEPRSLIDVASKLSSRFRAWRNGGGQ